MNAQRVPAPEPGRGHRAHLPGRPAERTLLAWDRTALLLAGHGAVLMVHEPSSAGPTRTAAALASLVLAALAVGLGLLRGREVANPGSVAHAGIAVHTLAVGLFGLGILDIVTIARA